MPQENDIGRRKTSTARLYIKAGNVELIVNGKPVDEYFKTKAQNIIALLPLAVTEKNGEYDVKVTVRGGGVTGQAGAVSLALARALDDLNEDVHSTLKEHGLITRAHRMVERKKYGQPKARKKFQFSKR